MRSKYAARVRSSPHRYEDIELPYTNPSRTPRTISHCKGIARKANQFADMVRGELKRVRFLWIKAIPTNKRLPKLGADARENAQWRRR